MRDPMQLIHACEAMRSTLPKAHFPAAWRTIDDLARVADDYDAFLFDAFGVLNVGETAIPGAAERIAQLRAAGRRVMVVSNAASLTKTALWHKYRKLGFDFSTEEIVSSREALIEALAQDRQRLRAQNSWGVMAPEGTDFSDLGVECWRLGQSEGKDEDDFRRADGFILLAAAQWNQAQQDRLLQALCAAPRPVLVANPDLVAPREHGWSLEPGYFARDIEALTGVIPRYYGKPHPEIFALALRRLAATSDAKIEARRVLMVGDTLHTDILGGRAAGFDTALITAHGVCRTLDLDAVIAQTGICPHLIAPRI